MTACIGRRDFITLLGGAAATASPLAARGQQAAKLPIIGFLGAGSASAYSQWTAAFVQRLRELGWVEDRTVAIMYRWAEFFSGPEAPLWGCGLLEGSSGQVSSENIVTSST